MSSPNNQPCPPTPAAAVFVPYNPERINCNGRSSTVAARKKQQQNSIPSNLLSCVQVKAIDRSKQITICANCASFLNDKFIKSWLRQMEDNNPSTPGVVGIAKRYQCKTLWIAQQGSSLLTPSPPTILLSSSPIATNRPPNDDPPICSKGHSTTSPLREKRSKANYSTGRWSSSSSSSIQTTNKEDSNKANKNNTNKRKRSHSASKRPPVSLKSPPNSPESVVSANFGYMSPPPDTTATNDIDIPKLKRRKLEKICVSALHRNKELYSELMEVQSQCNINESNVLLLENKVQSTTQQLDASNKANELLNNQNEELQKKLQDMKNAAKAQVEELREIRRQQEKDKKKSYKKGVRDGSKPQQQNQQPTIPLPDKLDAPALSTLIQESFQKVHRNKQPKRCAAIVASAVSTLYNGECKSLLKDWMTEEIRKDNPYRRAEEVAKVMDLCAGRLNLSGYNELRNSLESKNDNGKIPRGKGWLCSQHLVKEAQYAIEREAKKVIPYQMLDNDEIDGFELDYEKALLYLNDHVFNLSVVAKDPTQPRILWGFTCDGVRITRNITLVIAGVKCLDPRAVDPKTGEYISLVQSPDLCFPFKVIVAGDNKKTYRERLQGFFLWFKDLRNKQVGEYPAGTFDSVSPQDGSSLWKALARGGACKIKKEFCPYCSCTSSNCARPRTIPCDDCTATGQKSCFHYPVGDEKTYDNLQTSLDQLRTSFPFLAGGQEVMSRLHMRYEPQEGNKDITNIEYKPKGDEGNIFSQYVNKDLGVLGLSRLGSLNQRRARLMSALKTTTHYNDCAEGHEAAKYPGAMIFVRQAVPCILHLENRCGEKFMKSLLIETVQLSNKTPTQQKQLIAAIEEIANTRILGTQWRPSNWRIPVSQTDNKIVVQDMTMPNCHVRKFMQRFHELTAACFDCSDSQQNERKQAWDKCRDLWLVVVEMARKKGDFSDEEITSFQEHCDKFNVAWLDLLKGDSGMTNYFHVVAAGHLSYYLRQWRNLYRYSQQGWEGMNSVVKSVLHRRSQKGGHGGKKGEKNSKVEPIARWALRRMFFLSGDYKTITYKR